MSMHALVIAASVACRALLGIQVASFASLYVCVQRLRLKRKYVMILLIDKLPTRFYDAAFKESQTGELDVQTPANRSTSTSQQTNLVATHCGTFVGRNDTYMCSVACECSILSKGPVLHCRVGNEPSDYFHVQSGSVMTFSTFNQLLLVVCFQQLTVWSNTFSTGLLKTGLSLAQPEKAVSALNSPPQPAPFVAPPWNSLWPL